MAVFGLTAVVVLANYGFAGGWWCIDCSWFTLGLTIDNFLPWPISTIHFKTLVWQGHVGVDTVAVPKWPAVESVMLNGRCRDDLGHQCTCTGTTSGDKTMPKLS